MRNLEVYNKFKELNENLANDLINSIFIHPQEKIRNPAYEIIITSFKNNLFKNLDLSILALSLFEEVTEDYIEKHEIDNDTEESHETFPIPENEISEVYFQELLNLLNLDTRNSKVNDLLLILSYKIYEIKK